MIDIFNGDRHAAALARLRIAVGELENARHGQATPSDDALAARMGQGGCSGNDEPVSTLSAG